MKKTIKDRYEREKANCYDNFDLLLKNLQAVYLLYSAANIQDFRIEERKSQISEMMDMALEEMV